MKSSSMTSELIAACEAEYGRRWWLGLAGAISRLSGVPIRTVQRTTLRWSTGDADPTPAGIAAIRLLTISNAQTPSRDLSHPQGGKRPESDAE